MSKPSFNRQLPYITKFFALIFGLMLAWGLVLLLGPTVEAQGDNSGWSQPVILFQKEGSISNPTLAADQTGAAHLFWSFESGVLGTKDGETQAKSAEGEAAPLEDSQGQLLYYARWANGEWTSPVDIVAAPRAAMPSAVIDRSGEDHLVWLGPHGLTYGRAPASKAGSAKMWSRQMAIDLMQASAQITTDGTGQLHVAYPGHDTTGVYYTSSRDGGVTWSSPRNVAEPSRKSKQAGGENTAADYVHLAVGPDGTIHVVWTEFFYPRSWPPAGVFYSRSVDGGRSWSTPFEIAGVNHLQPNIVVVGTNTVHVVWNGAVIIGGRYHRWSNDGGQTWSETQAIVPPKKGGMEGAPQLAVDSAGTLHVLTTYSGCAWYTFFQNQKWAEPTCIAGEQARASRYIEEPALTITGGNRLIAVFWDDRKRLWYTTKETDAPVISPNPFLTAVPTATPEPLVTPTPIPTRTPAPRSSSSQDSEATLRLQVSPGPPLAAGLIPTAFLVLGLVAVTVIRQRWR